MNTRGNQEPRAYMIDTSTKMHLTTYRECIQTDYTPKYKMEQQKRTDSGIRSTSKFQEQNYYTYPLSPTDYMYFNNNT